MRRSENSLGVEPGVVTELEDVAHVLGQKRKEVGEALDVLRLVVEVGRQLVEDGAQGIAEQTRPVEERLQRLLAVLQTLDVGDEATGLHGEAEARRATFAPLAPGLLLGKTVEAVVQLDGGEVPARRSRTTWRRAGPADRRGPASGL